MLVYNPQHRLSTAIALQHPYFNEVRDINPEEFLNFPPKWPLTESLSKSQDAFGRPHVPSQ